MKQTPDAGLLEREETGQLSGGAKDQRTEGCRWTAELQKSLKKYDLFDFCWVYFVDIQALFHTIVGQKLARYLY